MTACATNFTGWNAHTFNFCLMCVEPAEKRSNCSKVWCVQFCFVVVRSGLGITLVIYSNQIITHTTGSNVCICMYMICVSGKLEHRDSIKMAREWCLGRCWKQQLLKYRYAQHHMKSHDRYLSGGFLGEKNLLETHTSHRCVKGTHKKRAVEKNHGKTEKTSQQMDEIAWKKNTTRKT